MYEAMKTMSWTDNEYAYNFIANILVCYLSEKDDGILFFKNSLLIILILFFNIKNDLKFFNINKDK